MLYIVPYKKEHGQIILSYQMNHKILEADRHFINIEGDAKNLEQDDLAFTGMVTIRGAKKGLIRLSRQHS